MKKVIVLLLLVFLVCSCSKSINLQKPEWIQIPCEWKYLGDELPFIKVKAYTTEFDSAKIVEYDCCIVNDIGLLVPNTLIPCKTYIFKDLGYTTFLFKKELSFNCKITDLILYIKRN